MHWLEFAVAHLKAPAARLCEIGARDGELADAFVRHGLSANATYIALTLERHLKKRLALHVHPSRSRIFRGLDYTVRSTPNISECDILLIRQASKFVPDLPNLMRRVPLSGDHIVLITGADSSWCDGWRHLVHTRQLLVNVSCHGRQRDGRQPWCAGKIASPSLCSSQHRAIAQRLAWRREHVSLPGLASQPWRYFSAFTCDGATCLVFKDHVREAWVGGVVSVDGEGLRFDSMVQLVMPSTWHTARMTHNLAILVDDGGGYLLAGGQHLQAWARTCNWDRGRHIPCRPGMRPHNGIWLVRGKSWRYSSTKGIAASTSLDWGANDVPSQWRDARPLINGSHPGCVERRSQVLSRGRRVPSTCEYDGRLSLVRFHGRLLLFTRANPAEAGERFVQLTTSVDDGRSWTPFQMIILRGYEHKHGEIYFFAAQVNPVHPSSMVAIFPMVHRFRGCIAASVSLDGQHWTAPTPLIPCDVDGERTIDHPVAGLLRRGERVIFYVHENVPGISDDRAFTQPQSLPSYLRRQSRLVRYSLPVADFRRWAIRSLREL